MPSFPALLLQATVTLMIPTESFSVDASGHSFYPPQRDNPQTQPCSANAVVFCCSPFASGALLSLPRDCLVPALGCAGGQRTKQGLPLVSSANLTARKPVVEGGFVSANRVDCRIHVRFPGFLPFFRATFDEDLINPRKPMPAYVSKSKTPSHSTTKHSARRLPCYQDSITPEHMKAILKLPNKWKSPRQ